MLALTVWQPWATAIAELGKDIENRSWCAPRYVIGQRIALHAGRTFDEAAARDIAALVPGVSPLWLAGQPRGAVLCTAVVEQVVEWSASPWFEGPFGWHLTGVRRLTQPVPCRGAQGLWHLSAADEALVITREQPEVSG